MPKKVDAEERRADLAAAAVRIIAENGLEGARLRDVAAEAGWTTGALTHYFPDKRALLKLALRSSLDRLQGRHIRAAEESGDELRVLLEQALPLDEDRLRHWRVSQVLSTQAWSDPELATEQRRAYRGWRRRIVILVAEGAADGRFPADTDAEAAADLLIAVVDGVALQALYDPERWPAEKQLGLLSRQLEELDRPSA